MTTNSISFSEANRLLRYDPLSGKLFWRVSQGTRKAGAPAGVIKNRGYVRVMINRREYLAHRIVCLLTFGQMPSAEVDHIDGDRSNNRQSNLRLATRSQNAFNRGKNANNTTGYKGVHRNRDRFRALICRQGKFIHLGMFDTAEEAHVAYCKTFRAIHGEFGRSS